jgi:hypothetical protein
LKESKKKINDAIVGYVEKGSDKLKEHAAAAAAAAPKEDDKGKAVASSFSAEELNGPLIFGLLSANVLTASFAFKFYKHSKDQKTFSGNFQGVTLFFSHSFFEPLCWNSKERCLLQPSLEYENIRKKKPRFLKCAFVLCPFRSSIQHVPIMNYDWTQSIFLCNASLCSRLSFSATIVTQRCV